jgi:hypothetical protein
MEQKPTNEIIETDETTEQLPAEIENTEVSDAVIAPEVSTAEVPQTAEPQATTPEVEASKPKISLWRKILGGTMIGSSLVGTPAALIAAPTIEEHLQNDKSISVGGEIPTIPAIDTDIPSGNINPIVAENPAPSPATYKAPENLVNVNIPAQAETAGENTPTPETYSIPTEKPQN